MFTEWLRRFLRMIMPPTLATSEDVTKVFLELFQGHGLPCELCDGWITPYSGRFQAFAQVEPREIRAGRFSTQLDLVVRTADGRTMGDSCGGSGATIHAAIADAIQTFCAGSFHVIFSAFSGQICSHCETEEWEIGGIRRRVFCGPAFIRGQWDDTVKWFEWMRSAIESQPLSPGMRWLRIYHGEFPGGDPVDEAMIDNEPCPALESRCAAFPWPPAEQFFSIRYFMIVTDVLD